MITFEKEDNSFIIHDIWFYYVDKYEDKKLFLGSTSGDFSIDESRAKLAFEEEKAKAMNAFKT